MILKGRRFYITGGGPPVINPPIGGGDIVNVTVNFGSVPVASSRFPKLKYNKNKIITMEFDDNSPEMLDAYEKLKTTYYTDGCGNNRNYSLGIATNGRHQYDNREVGTAPDAVTFSKRNELIPFGLDIMNHAFYHDPEGNFNNGTNLFKNFRDLDLQVFEKQNGYRMNVLVVPTNYAGYQLLARDNGYIGGTSEGTFDGLVSLPVGYASLGQTNILPNQNYYPMRRAFSDIWTNTTATQWSLVNDLFNDATLDYLRVGTHGLNGNPTNFNNWIDSIVTKANDTALFSSLREFLEYVHVTKTMTKTESIVGNSLKVKLDYSTVHNERIRWFDASLVVDSNKPITSVTIDNPDFTLTYNAATKLVNITKRKISWETA